MIRHWDFVAVHMGVALLFVTVALVLWRAWVGAFIAANTALWVVCEAWDHGWDWLSTINNPQAMAEWLAPALVFAVVLPVSVIVIGRR